jgi:hypothetical protein
VNVGQLPAARGGNHRCIGTDHGSQFAQGFDQGSAVVSFSAAP